MARRAFFSFKYEDVSRAMVVRNSWMTLGREAAGFVDAAAFERIKRQGDGAIKRWIDSQMVNTSVTVVLIGAQTDQSRWVRYEIETSEARGNGLLGIDISQIRDFHGRPSQCCGELKGNYANYSWVRDNGYKNIGAWIERAAKQAGR